MTRDKAKTKAQLINELEEMRRRMADFEATAVEAGSKLGEQDLALRNRDLLLLNQASRALNATLDLDQVLTIVLEEIQRLVDVTGCSVWLVDPETRELVCRQATGARSELVRGWRLAPGQGLAGWVAQSGQKLIVPDTRSDKRHFKGVDEEIGLEMRSILSVPLRIKQEVIGALHMLHTEVDRFQPADQRLLESLAATAAIAIENAQLYEALKISREQARNIIECSLDVIIAVDVNRRIVTFNRAAQKTFGYRPKEVLGKPVDVLYANRQESLTVHERTRQQGQWTQEILNKRKNGRVFPSMLSSSVLRNARGQVVGYMGVSRDITERKRVEEAVQQSQERMQTLVEHLSEGIVLLDSKIRIVLTNPAADEFLTVLEVGKSDDKLTGLGGHAVEALLTTEPAGVTLELEVEDPRRRNFELAVKPIRAGPEAGGWFIVMRDVTEEREAQEHIRQQERLAAIGQLAAGMAHDFNNILTSIIGFTELVYRDPTVPEAARDDLGRVIQQGQRAAYLTRQILDFSRKSVPVKRLLDLAPFLQETVLLLEPMFPDNIRILFSSSKR
jgi:PAS domain S-box-containing protein